MQRGGVGSVTLLFLAACGSAPAPARPPAPAVAHQPPTPPDAADPDAEPPRICDAGPLVDAAAREAWEDDGDDHYWLDCVRLERRAGALWVATDGAYWALVTPAAEVIWSYVEDTSDYGFQNSDFEATDLDGDGDDELVFTMEYGEGGYSARHLAVGGVAGDALVFDYVPIEGGAVDGDDSGCSSSWAVLDRSPGPRRVEITTTADRPGVCTPGASRYVWKDRRLNLLP